MIGPFVYGLAILLIAGVVHLASILALPWLAKQDGFHRLDGLAAPNRMMVMSEAQMRATLPTGDPAVATALCRYVLEGGPVRVRILVGPTPTSVVVLRKGAGVFHSVSDKSATQGVLDVVIATAGQIEDITEQDTDDDPVQEIRLTSPSESGLVLVRALVPLPSMRADVESALSTATCEAETLSK